MQRQRWKFKDVLREIVLLGTIVLAPALLLPALAQGPSFAVPVNDLAMALAAPHAIGDGRLSVAPGQGAKVGNAFPVRLTGVRTVDHAKVRFLCTAKVSADVLAVTPISSGPDATPDLALAIGDAIEGRITAGSLLELQAAILAGGGSGVDATAVHLTTPDTITGLKTITRDGGMASGGPGVPSLAIQAATADAGFASIRLSTNNHAGVTDSVNGNGNGEVQFYDGLAGVESFRVMSSPGNTPSSQRFNGLLSGADRDGNKLPFRITTADSAGGNLAPAFVVGAGQAPGQPGPVSVPGTLTAGAFVGNGAGLTNLPGGGGIGGSGTPGQLAGFTGPTTLGNFSGVIPAANLGTGPANSTTMLGGDGVFRAPPGAHPLGGIRTADVRDFGAVPWADAGTPGPDNALAFQAAVDSLVDPASLSQGRINFQHNSGSVHVPTGIWTLNSPVFAQDYIKFCGEGSNATTLTSRQVSTPIIHIGPRKDERMLASPLWTSMHTALSFASITGNVATFTTSAAHPYTVGTYLSIFDAGTPYDGMYQVATVPDTTHFTVALTHADISPAATGGTADWPLHYAPNHRESLDGQFDASVTGRGLYSISSVMPGSPAAIADHFLCFADSPMQAGAHDAWGGANSRQLTIQFAIRGIGSGNLGHGPIMGMGALQQEPLEICPWALTAGTWDNSIGNADSDQFHFYFRTNPAGATNPPFYSPRRFSFGNTAVSGWQHISLKVNLAANDGSGMCEVAAFQNGTQVAVTRQYGTELASASGTEPSFKAADNLNFAAGTFYPFCVLASSGDMATPLNATFDPNDGSHSAGLIKAKIGGLRIDVGTSPIQNNGVSSSEKLVSPNVVPTYFQKYFDNTISPSTCLAWLPMSDPPHNAAINSDRLVTYKIGAASTAAAGNFGYGIAGFDEQTENAGSNVTTRSGVRGMTLIGAPTYGCPLVSSWAFDVDIDDVTVSQGWTGCRIQNGYDHRITRFGGTGDDSILTGTNSGIGIHDMWRSNVGRTALRFACCRAKVDEVFIGQYGSYGQTTETYIACHGWAGGFNYGSEYRFRGLELDNESGGSPQKAVIWVERNPWNTYTSLIVDKMWGPLQPNKDVPWIVLAGPLGLQAASAIGDKGTAYPPGTGLSHARISGLEETDGYCVRVDDQSWRGVLQDCLTTERLGNPYYEPIRFNTASGIGNMVARITLPALPRTGRFAPSTELTVRNAGIGAAAYNAGTTYLQGAYVVSAGLYYTSRADGNVGNTPASSPTQWTAGIVKTWVCFAAGTGPWDAGTYYWPANTCSSGGIEYFATGAAGPLTPNVNHAPPDATWWTAGGAVSAPTWKPLAIIPN